MNPVGLTFGDLDDSVATVAKWVAGEYAEQGRWPTQVDFVRFCFKKEINTQQLREIAHDVFDSSLPSSSPVQTELVRVRPWIFVDLGLFPEAFTMAHAQYLAVVQKLADGLGDEMRVTQDDLPESLPLSIRNLVGQLLVDQFGGERPSSTGHWFATITLYHVKHPLLTTEAFVRRPEIPRWKAQPDSEGITPIPPVIRRLDTSNKEEVRRSVVSDVPETARRILQGSNWVPLKKLGSGGGGEVYLSVRREIGEAIDADNADFSSRSASNEDAVAAIRKYAAVAAVKLPHEETRRFHREIEAMRTYQHPALIRLIDVDQSETLAWFAVEYHSHGSLDDEPNREFYRGKPIDILRAILPVAEGLGVVHEGGAIHRDVKPKNIFVSNDRRLVLGDFGIVLPTADATRMTEKGVAHSKDWVPDWVQFGQERTYTQLVDVFALAKVIYFLLVGENIMASQFPYEATRLRKEHATDMPGLLVTLSLLEKCVVTSEKDLTISNGTSLASAIRSTLVQHDFAGHSNNAIRAELKKRNL